MSTEKTLADIMEFDHIIKVNSDGTIEDDVPNLYAPTMTDDELDSSDWELVTHGYTNQFGYNGPTLHPSEQISGMIETRILSEPGVYVALVSYSSQTDEQYEAGEDNTAGWAIARYTAEG